ASSERSTARTVAVPAPFTRPAPRAERGSGSPGAAGSPAPPARSARAGRSGRPARARGQTGARSRRPRAGRAASAGRRPTPAPLPSWSPGSAEPARELGDDALGEQVRHVQDVQVDAVVSRDVSGPVLSSGEP